MTAQSPVMHNPDLTQRLAQAAGLRVREQDWPTLAHWCQQRCQPLGLSGLEQYAGLLAQDNVAGQAERELLTVRFTTGESYFLRDAGQFDLLATKILPELIARRAGSRTLRLWSAGCSTGEEAYSLAMLVDQLAPQLASWNVLILGSDINPEALEKARSGRYREWSFRSLDESFRSRYFTEVGDQWQIAPRLRAMLSWRQLDLVRHPFPDAEVRDFDLILCRNVLIYLDGPAVGCITAKFAAALAEGGYLLAGHNELFGHDTAPLRIHLFAQSAAYQKPGQEGAESLPDQLPLPVPLQVPEPALFQPEPFQHPLLAKVASAAADPPDRDARMQAARRHADAGRPDAATLDCQQVIALDRFDPRPYFLLAQLAQERADTGQARTLLDKVIYLDPGFIAAYLELGGLYAQAGDTARARRMYQTARTALQELDPQTVVAPYDESSAADVLTFVKRLLAMLD